MSIVVSVQKVDLNGKTSLIGTATVRGEGRFGSTDSVSYILENYKKIKKLSYIINIIYCSISNLISLIILTF